MARKLPAFPAAATGDNHRMDDRAPTVVVVGASAGGVEALTTLADGLPEDLEAAVCVVLHLPAGAESRLAEIISRAGTLSAVQAQGGEPLDPGRIYVAPPDRHLIVRDSHVAVECGPHENDVRPSIDVLFRSAALAYGRRTVAVVLSGTRDDGVAGASAVGACGGCVLVQDPEDALFATLPAYAVAHDNPDTVLPLSELTPAVVAAVHRLSEEADVSENGGGEMSLDTYTADAVADRKRDSVETALWTALHALQERAQLTQRLADRVGSAGAERSRKRFEASAAEARGQAETIRRLLAGPGAPDD
jgi:two-component system chemotaxis response regulator CheB